jgi:hypothetical protein
MKATMKVEFDPEDVTHVLREYVENKYGKAPAGFEYRVQAWQYNTIPPMIVEAFKTLSPAALERGTK